jgi:hypothetical protein
MNRSLNGLCASCHKDAAEGGIPAASRLWRDQAGISHDELHERPL